MIKNSNGINPVQFPESWYPLCRSKELDKGQVIGMQLFGKKLAVFRTETNVVSAVDARCCHIGADLSRGRVDGEVLTCPLHHWSYAVDGKCANIPCQKNIPSQVKQRAFHCAEHYGLVYVYWGQEPDFSLPTFQNVLNSVYSVPGIIDLDVPCEYASANLVDMQRMVTFHHQQVASTKSFSSQSKFHFGLKYSALLEPRMMYDKLLHALGSKDTMINLDCWGGNLFLISYLDVPFKTNISFLPLSENQTRVFISTSLPQNKNVMLIPFKLLIVQILNKLALVRIRRDFSALVDMDFKFLNVLPGVDTILVKWHRYWQSLPREVAGKVRNIQKSYTMKNITRDKCDEIPLLK